MLQYLDACWHLPFSLHSSFQLYENFMSCIKAEKKIFICKITTGELIMFQQCGIWFSLTRWTMWETGEFDDTVLFSVFIWWKIHRSKNDTDIEFSYFLWVSRAEFLGHEPCCPLEKWFCCEDYSGRVLALVSLEKWPTLYFGGKILRVQHLVF